MDNRKAPPVALAGRYGRQIPPEAVRHNMVERDQPFAPMIAYQYHVPTNCNSYPTHNQAHTAGNSHQLGPNPTHNQVSQAPPAYQTRQWNSFGNENHPNGGVSEFVGGYVGGGKFDPRHYYPDPRSPRVEAFTTARLILEENYGGFCGSIPVIKTVGTTMIGGKHIAEDRKVKAYRYKCSIKTCRWKAQIRMSSASQRIYQDGCDLYSIYIQPNNVHGHGTTRLPPHHLDQHGLHPFLKDLFHKFVKDMHRRGRSVLQIAPMEVTKFLCSTIRTDNTAYIYLIASATAQYHVTEQVDNHMKGLRKAHIKKLIGVERILNNDHLMRILSRFRLHIPFGYKPRWDCATPDELANALGIPGPESGHMFIFNICEGPVYDRYKKVFVGDTERSIAAFDARTDQTFFAMSSVGLWQLMHLALRRKGTRQICVDGTGGTCQDLAPTVVLGALSTKMRKTSVTSSFRPLCYLKAGESIHPYLLTLFHMHIICWKLFSLRLYMDVGTSDNSDTFQKGSRMYIKNADVLQSEQASPDDLVLLPKTPGLNKKETITDYLKARFVTEFPDSAEEEPEALPSDSVKDDDVNFDVFSSLPIVSQYSQEMPELKSKKELGWTPNITVPLIFLVNVVGTTLCWFHIMQHFVQRNSFVAKFVDKNFAASPGTRSQRKKKQPRGKMKEDKQKPTDTKTASSRVTAFTQVSWIHHAKSVAQRGALMLLVILDWIVRQEVKAANHFYHVYCRGMYMNWNFMCTGEPSVYPSNCSIESNNHHSIKGGTHPVRPNVSVETYIVETIPRLLMNDVHHGRDPCTIEYPKNCSPMIVAVTACFRHHTDVREMYDHLTGRKYWLTNQHEYIGIPICDQRVHLMEQALAGNVNPFMPRRLHRDMYSKAACKMTKATKSLCKVVERDGTMLGDCINCWKFGGYGCPGASYLRSSRPGMFYSSLEKKRQVPANSRGQRRTALVRGPKETMYWKGKPLVAITKPEEFPMLKSDSEYLRTLDASMVRDVMKYLRITKYVERGVDPLEVLIQFQQCPETFRRQVNGKTSDLKRHDAFSGDDNDSAGSWDVMAEMDDDLMEDTTEDPDNVAFESLMKDLGV